MADEAERHFFSPESEGTLLAEWNADLSGVRRERRAITTRSPRGQELGLDLEASPVEPDWDRLGLVTAWVVTLPLRQQQVYELLYEQGLTQRQVAEILGVSQ